MKLKDLSGIGLALSASEETRRRYDSWANPIAHAMLARRLRGKIIPPLFGRLKYDTDRPDTSIGSIRWPMGG